MHPMYKLIVPFLLLPSIVFAQVKNHPAKKKKAGHVQSAHKTFWPPKVNTSEVTIPPPAMPSEPEAVNGEKIEIPVLVKSASWREALQQASERQVGLILFVPGNMDSMKYSGFSGDSSRLTDYFEELFAQGINSYKRKYLVYMASAAELATEKKIHVLLYPAYLFYNAEGVLLGKREGVKTDAYEIDAMQQEMRDAADRKVLTALQQQYYRGNIDSVMLAKLVVLTAAFNASSYTNTVKPDQYDLLETFISRYATGKKADTGIFKLVEQVYNDAGYIREISATQTLHWLVDNYALDRDMNLKWYASLSNRISQQTAAILTPMLEEGSKQPDTPALPADSILFKRSLAIDSVMHLHSSFIKRLHNLQLLNETVKLLQTQYDVITKRMVPAGYAVKTTLPMVNWFFDSLLHVNQGINATALLLKETGIKLSVPEQEYVDEYYTSFANFDNRFRKDLGLLLNNISWIVFKEDSLNHHLSKLLLWSRASLEIEKTNPYYLDTYAQLLYANGDKKSAAEYEQKSINVLKLDKNFREERWMLPFMEKVLTKMKAGAILPRDDYYPNN